MKFKDSKEREWNVSLTVGTVEKVKEDTEIDLDLFLRDSDRLANLLYMDPKKLVQVMYSICESQIAEREMSPRDFASVFDRATLDKAGDAFIESIIDFYPRSSIGQTIKGRLPELLAKMDQKAREKTSQSIEKTLSN